MAYSAAPALLKAATITYFHLLRYDIRDHLPKRTTVFLDLAIASIAEHYERYIGFSYHDYDCPDNNYVIVDEAGRAVMLHVTEDTEHVKPGFSCAVLIKETADNGHLGAQASQSPTTIIQLQLEHPGRDDHYVDPTPLLTWLHYWVTDAKPPASLYDDVFAGQITNLV